MRRQRQDNRLERPRVGIPNLLQRLANLHKGQDQECPLQRGGRGVCQDSHADDQVWKPEVCTDQDLRCKQGGGQLQVWVESPPGERQEHPAGQAEPDGLPRDEDAYHNHQEQCRSAVIVVWLASVFAETTAEEAQNHLLPVTVHQLLGQWSAGHKDGGEQHVQANTPEVWSKHCHSDGDGDVQRLGSRPVHRDPSGEKLPQESTESGQSDREARLG